MSIRQHVEAYLACGCEVPSCAEIRQFCEDKAGYPVQGTAVSRVMGNLGWQRFTDGGKVHFRRPSKP